MFGMSLAHRLAVLATFCVAIATGCVPHGPLSTHSGHDAANPALTTLPIEDQAGETATASSTSRASVAEPPTVPQVSPLIASADPGDGSWWDVPYPNTFDKQTLTRDLPRVAVRGNSFVDEAGTRVSSQGVNIADPDKLSREGHWGKTHFETIASWGANVVRIPSDTSPTMTAMVAMFRKACTTAAGRSAPVRNTA